MKSIVEIIFISAIAYLLMFILAKMFWIAYPYPENATQSQMEMVWGIHVLSEKLFSYALTAIVAIYGVYRFKSSHGKRCIGIAIVGGVSYHIIGAIIYIAQFGIQPYLQYSMPFQLVLIVLTVSGVAALAAYNLLPNQALKAQPSAAGTPKSGAH